MYVSPLTQLKSNKVETKALNSAKPKFSQKQSVLGYTKLKCEKGYASLHGSE